MLGNEKFETSLIGFGVLVIPDLIFLCFEFVSDPSTWLRTDLYIRLSDSD